MLSLRAGIIGTEFCNYSALGTIIRIINCKQNKHLYDGILGIKRYKRIGQLLEYYSTFTKDFL